MDQSTVRRTMVSCAQAWAQWHGVTPIADLGRLRVMLPARTFMRPISLEINIRIRKVVVSACIEGGYDHVMDGMRRELTVTLTGRVDLST